MDVMKANYSLTTLSKAWLLKKLFREKRIEICMALQNIPDTPQDKNDFFLDCNDYIFCSHNVSLMAF